MQRVWRSKRTGRGGTDRRESDVATYKDKGFMDVHTRNETKEWKKERRRGMCHHSCMMSCYSAKGGPFLKPLDPSGGFLGFEAKPNMLLFFG